MSLDSFHPALAVWFRANLGSPTEAQACAWPAIQAGRHTLIAAPTGSGKTLAAFYVAINDLVERGLRNELADSTQVIYVSPLKALGNDIQRNLEAPLDGIAEQLHLQCLPPVNIRVAVRTGDTPASERQRMLKKPPHILVTTPESLYLLLSSKGGRRMLAGARTLILDEIHALLGDKRGSHLSLSLERLEHVAGRPLQRIGLSATQKPLDLVARFLVGNRHIHEGDVDCAIIDGGHRRALDLSLEVPRSPMSAIMSNEVWEELYERLVELVDQHRTTLIFVNTRRLAERLALSLGERLGEGTVSSHHGSMSKEHRHAAEQQLKAGKLRVLVATASMELGIDIGSVDLVVQFASPHSIAAFLQRVGRSGHQVGGVSKGILFPLTRDDLVECAALLDSIQRGELDRIVMPDKPLDILAQQIVAEAGSLEDAEMGIELDALYRLCKGSWVYRDLAREEFDRIVAMLAEGFSTRRGRRGAYLHLDRINGRLRPRGNARLTALTNGGAIPDMFDYQVVLDPEDVVVGTLNEDFALESLPGDVFTLGNHSWRLLGIDGQKVRVVDAGGQAPSIPFWFGEGPGRTRELSEAVSRLRLDVRDLLEQGVEAAMTHLVGQVGLQPAAAQQLAEYLQAGCQALGVMPSRECIVMERFFDEVGDMHLVIHSPYGSRVNKAWGLALRKRFCRSFNFELQAAANEDSIVISLGAVHSFPLADVFRYLQTATVRQVLVQALLDAPMFEVRWRWNATRALAVQRNRKGQRVPPQIQRMQAEDLVAQVFPDQIACLENIRGEREVPDHPLVCQTVEDCLHEAMDVEELLDLLGAIERDEIELVARDLREPSPFAQEIINARPYAFLDDAPFEERRTNAIRHRSWLDPAETEEFSVLDPAAIERVREESWPLVRSAEELHDALLTLGFMSEAEVRGGAEGGNGDCSPYLESLLRAGRVTQLVLEDRREDAAAGDVRLWIASERLPQFEALDMAWRAQPVPALPETLRGEIWSAEDALREILRGRLEGLGPVSVRELAGSLGLARGRVEQALIGLESEGFVIRGRFSSRGPAFAANEEEWCERRLLQRIHRYTIEAHRESIRPVSLQSYMQFLFELHGIVPAGQEEAIPPAPVADPGALQEALRRLDGITAPAAAWETDILPARLAHYDPAGLDTLCISGRVAWGRLLVPKPPAVGAGAGGGRKAGPVRMTPINLMQRENLNLWQALAAGRDTQEERPVPGGDAARVAEVLARLGACFFDDIVRDSGLLRSQAEAALAELVSRGLASSDGFTGLRALLIPAARRAAGSRRRGRRPAYSLEEAGRWSLTRGDASEAPELDDEALERLIDIYLDRWGVISRKVLERETLAPPWRQLLLKLRRRELRGELRGGRFIAGIGGEQFARPDTVQRLRDCHKAVRARGEGSHPGAPRRVVLGAADPLNLLGVALPEKKVPNLSGNRILFEDGLPVAVQEKDQIRFLRDAEASEQGVLRQLMQRPPATPRLRAYLGRS